MINEYFSLYTLTVEQSVLVKTTGYAVNPLSYRIIPLLFSLMLSKPLHLIVRIMLTINEETFRSKSNAFI